MDWTDIDIDEAAKEVWKRNRTKTKIETIKAMMRKEKETPHALTGYTPEASFKVQQIALGQVAERLAAGKLSSNDPTVSHLLSPDNNNDRDIYVVRGGSLVPEEGYQVKLGDPNEHIFYTLSKSIRGGNRDTIILDGSLHDGEKLTGFTKYKGQVLQDLIDKHKVKVVGMNGLASIAKTIRDKEAATNPLKKGALGILELVKKLKYGY